MEGASQRFIFKSWGGRVGIKAPLLHNPGLTIVRNSFFSPVAFSLSATHTHTHTHTHTLYYTPVIPSASASTTMRLVINLPVILLALAAGSFALPKMADVPAMPQRSFNLFFFPLLFNLTLSILDIDGDEVST
jgi:hypothetical protein